MTNKNKPPIRIGVLGLGPAGAALIAYIDADSRFVLSAVCDQNPTLLARYSNRKDVTTHATLASLCADKAVDAAYVATPTWYHAQHSIALMAAGKHVIVEKPMANNRDDAALMLDQSRRSGTCLIVGHSQSFEATVRVMRAVIDSGALGRLRAINGWSYTDWMFKPRNPTEFDRSLGGGVVFRQAAHQVDIVRFLTRTSPDMVHAVVGDWDATRPGDGSYTAFMTFPDQVVATLFYSGYDHFSSMELTHHYGANGVKETPSHGASRRVTRTLTSADEALKKHGNAAESRRGGINTPGLLAAFGLFVISCEHGDMRVGETGVTLYDDHSPWTIPTDGLPLGRAALLNELAEAMDGATPAHDGQWGLANLEVCTAMLDSSERRAPVMPDFKHSRAADSHAQVVAHVAQHLRERAQALKQG
jgi:phthalate 4,5-cis-dihydrodiol dehydrogenase